MKIIILTFIWILLVNAVGYAQIRHIDSVEIPENNLPIGIRITQPEDYTLYFIKPVGSQIMFLPNNQYWILDYDFTMPDFKDNQNTYTISFGHYTIQSDRNIILKDTLGYQMIISQKKEPITFISGFDYLQRNTLMGEKEKYTHAFQALQLPLDLKGKRQQAIAMQECFNLTSMYVYVGIILSLNDNGTYTLSIDKSGINVPNVDYSKGQWKRKGNLLTLTDSSLKHSFYAIILPDGELQSMILPGLYEGQIMKGVKPL